jgi:hypothetical protein
MRSDLFGLPPRRPRFNLVVQSCTFGYATAWARCRLTPGSRSTRPINDSWITACCYLVREQPLATFNMKDQADFTAHERLELVH